MELFILILLGVLVAVSLGLGIYMFRFAYVREKNSKRQYNMWKNERENPLIANMKPEYKERVHEGEKWIRRSLTDVVDITSRDGWKLVARIIENPEGRGVAVCMHGYRSSPLLDYSCSARELYNRGFTLILPDERAHADSEGRFICFGALERFDSVDWAKYAEERYPGQPILMCGVSMGSTTVMMGAGVGYPASVKALLLDCGFSSPGAICRKVLKTTAHLPPFPAYTVSKLFAKWFAHFDPDGVSAREGLEKLRGTGVRVLMIHGKNDNFVPFAMSEENIKAFDYLTAASARQEIAEFLPVEGAGHAMSFLTNPDAYLAAVDRLLARAGI